MMAPDRVLLPLLRHPNTSATLAYRGGHAILVGTFLADVAALAAALPQHGHVLNLCRDRYRFAVGLAASIVRGQISLLPPSHNAEMVRQVQTLFPDVYCLAEEAQPELDLPLHLFPPARQEPPSGPADLPQIPQIDAEQTVAYVFTSGSTGQPTVHRKRWGSLARCALAEGQRTGLLDRPVPTSIIGTVAPQHMYGLESTVLLAWQTGCAIVAARPFYAADIAAALNEVPAPRLLVSTPFHLRSLLAELESIPALDLIISATAPLSPNVAAEVEQRTGAPLLEIYGATETGQLATRRTTQTAEWTAFSGIGLEERGACVWASGAHIEQPTPLNDIVELKGSDAEGTRFILHGRSADMVNVAGKRTSLGYLNLQLNAIPGVLDGVFFCPPGDRPDGATVRLTAFVVAPTLDASSLRRALRQRIDPAFMPRPLHFVDALPRNDNGKLPQAALHDLARNTPTRTRRSSARHEHAATVHSR